MKPWDIAFLLTKPEIRNDQAHEFLNKMTDEEIKVYYEFIDAKLTAKGVSKHFPDRNATVMAAVINDQILYTLLKDAINPQYSIVSMDREFWAVSKLLVPASRTCASNQPDCGPDGRKCEREYYEGLAAVTCKYGIKIKNSPQEVTRMMLPGGHIPDSMPRNDVFRLWITNIAYDLPAKYKVEIGYEEAPIAKDEEEAQDFANDQAINGPDRNRKKVATIVTIT